MKTVTLNGYPDSIAKAGDRVFISCQRKETSVPDKKSGGFIVEVDKNGTLISQNAFPKVSLHFPKGITVVRNILYIADGDRIMGIDLKTGNSCCEIPLPVKEGQEVTDIASTPDGLLYTALSQEGEILLVSPKENSSPEIKKIVPSAPLRGIHGMALDGDFLYITGHEAKENGAFIGRIWKMNITNGDVSLLLEGDGRFDGIAVDHGILYFSDWNRGDNVSKDGAIRKMNLETKEVTDLTKIDLKWAADFLIDEPSHSIWIPVYLDKAVIFAPLAD